MAVIDRGIGFDGEGFVFGDPVPGRVGGVGLVGQLRSVCDLLDAMVGEPLAGCDDVTLKAVAEARRMRGCTERVIMRAGAVARERSTTANCETSGAAPEPGPGEPDLGSPSGRSSGVSFEEVMGGTDWSEPAAVSRQDTARAEVLAALPRLGAAVAAAEVGAAQVDVFVRAFKRFDCPDTARGVLDSLDMIRDAGWLPADSFARLLWKRVNAVLDRATRQAEAEQKRQASTFSFWFDEKSGMGRLNGQLDPERYEAVATALEQHMAPLAQQGGVTKDKNLRAAALVDLVTGSGRRSSNLPYLTVVVGPDGDGETSDGRPLAPEAVSRLAEAQWAALKALYSQCAWERCAAPISWCQAHHLHSWETGGLTDLCNLVPLCSKHHHMVHDQGWDLRLHKNRPPANNPQTDPGRSPGGGPHQTRPEPTPTRIRG